MTLPDTRLSPEAERLLNRIKPRIHSRLEEANRVPVSVLIWGPGLEADHPLSGVRSRLRTDLRKRGHAAAFSEELIDPDSPYSLRLQELAQAQEFDLVVSLPCTPGSIAEIHDFAIDRRVGGRILVFLNKQYLLGYSSQSIESVSSIISCVVEYYPRDSETDIIETRTLEEVQRIRELKYYREGRY